MENRLMLIIGEKPIQVPKQFSNIDLYTRIDNKIEYYGSLNTIYNFDIVSLIDIPNDPRYYLEETQNDNGIKIRCELKVFGEDKGLHQIIHGHRHKVAKINTIIDEKEQSLLNK